MDSGKDDTLIFPIAPISNAELDNLDPALTSIIGEIMSDSGRSDAAEKNKPRQWCGVCGLRAAGGRYYGGVTCYGCRAFFKRACQASGGGGEGPAYRDFVCDVGVGKCLLAGEKSRPDCR